MATDAHTVITRSSIGEADPTILAVSLEFGFAMSTCQMIGTKTNPSVCVIKLFQILEGPIIGFAWNGTHGIQGVHTGQMKTINTNFKSEMRRHKFSTVRWYFGAAGLILVVGTVLALSWWVSMSKQAQVDQSQLQAIVDEGRTRGYAFTYFYEGRVRLTSDGLTHEQMKQLVDVLKRIKWLRRLEFFAANLNDSDYEWIREALPEVNVASHW